MKAVDSTGALGRLTAVLLVLMGLLNLSELAVIAAGWISGMPFNPPLTPGDGLGTLQLVFGGTVCLWTLVLLLAAVCFLAWLRQTTVRQRRLGQAPAPARGPAANALRVVALLVPYPQLRDVFTAEGTRPGDQPPLLGPWLACVLLALAVGVLQLVLQGAAVATPSSGGLFNALSCIRALLLAAAAFLAARFLRELEARRSRRAAASP